MRDQREVCGCHRECTDLPHTCEVPCRWPGCLSEGEKDRLAAEVCADCAVMTSIPPCATRWPPNPEPGDFAVVPSLDIAGVAISAAEDAEAMVRDRTVLFGREWRHWDHAFIYLGGGQVGEAEPGGFRIRDLGVWGPQLYGAFARWSSGTIALTRLQRGGIVATARALAAANGGKGIGYSGLDYAAIALHDLHIPAPGLRSYIASSGHMICSQAVDYCYAANGAHLFTDGRWPGYVDPEDLALCVWDWPPGHFA